MRSLGVMLGYIRDATTETGLKVEAFLVNREYRKRDQSLGQRNGCLEAGAAQHMPQLELLHQTTLRVPVIRIVEVRGYFSTTP
jgi:hypothetical protein